MNGEVRQVTAQDLLAEVGRLQAAGFDYLSLVTAVDFIAEDQIELVYCFYSIASRKGPVTLKLRLPRTAPRAPSLLPLFRSADLQEREIYDLFGVEFEGRPGIKRLLLWDTFQGHPLRKDFQPDDDDRPVIMDERRGQ